MSDRLLALQRKLEHATHEIRDEYLNPTHQTPWVVAFSAGKDSTLLLQLTVETLLEIAPGDRRRKVHLISNDTRVESPLYANYFRRSIDRIARAAPTLGLPLTVHVTQPAPEQTFWVLLIGRGYRAPSRHLRWCTDRLKIQPTSRYIRDRVGASGQAILLLGVRRTESANREATARRFDNESRLNPHSTLKGCHIFRPILDFTTEDVWTSLLLRRPPWGGSNREVVSIYRQAQGDCPLVLDHSAAPACGSSSVRFGCWTCTVVSKDRSLQGLIDAGWSGYEPLSEFRDWLKHISEDPKYRSAIRRNGKAKFSPDGILVPGPFTLAARREILERLLATQAKVGFELITEDEISRIKKQWAEDVIALQNLRRNGFGSTRLGGAAQGTEGPDK